MKYDDGAMEKHSVKRKPLVKAPQFLGLLRAREPMHRHHLARPGKSPMKAINSAQRAVQL
jgi:hypothetical protein